MSTRLFVLFVAAVLAFVTFVRPFDGEVAEQTNGRQVPAAATSTTTTTHMVTSTTVASSTGATATSTAPASPPDAATGTDVAAATRPLHQAGQVATPPPNNAAGGTVRVPDANCANALQPQFLGGHVCGVPSADSDQGGAG